MAASYQSHIASKNKKTKKNTTFPSQNMALNLLRLDDYKENKINVILDFCKLFHKFCDTK